LWLAIKTVGPVLSQAHLDPAGRTRDPLLRLSGDGVRVNLPGGNSIRGETQVQQVGVLGGGQLVEGFPGTDPQKIETGTGGPGGGRGGTDVEQSVVG
jgi:hypothetical protein